MKSVALSIVLCLVLCASALARSGFSGKVVNVADGDTLTVLAPGNQQVKVRLYGVDCPEKRQAFGNVARRFTADFAAGKTASVEIMDTDRYGRTVGLVEVDGVSLNQALIASGLAWVYPQYCKANFCRQWKLDEAKAARARKGLWHDSNPVPPWNWRRSKRK